MRWTGARALAIFILTFANGWLGPWDAQILFLIPVLVFIFLEWVRAERGVQVFALALAAFAGTMVSNHMALIHATQTHYGVSWGSSVFLFSLFTLASSVPFAVGVWIWFRLGRAFHLDLLPRLLSLPFFLYLGDLLIPQLFPAGLMTVFSFYRLPSNQLFSVLGIEGVKFLYYLVVALLAAGWGLGQDRGRGRGRWAVLWPWLAGALALVVALWAGGEVERRRWLSFDGEVRVGVFQSNFAYDFSTTSPQWWDQERKLLEKFRGVVAGFALRPDFVVFAETEFIGFSIPEKGIASALSDLARQHGIPLLGGFETFGTGGEKRNSFLVFDDNGEVQHVYHKRMLFPFAEYRPFPKSWPLIGELFPEMDVYVPGKSVEDSVWTLGTRVYGVGICYEDLFTGNFADASRLGSEINLSITSDNLFGPSAIAYGHEAIARGRALEARRPFVRIVRSGPSFVMSADGRTVWSAPFGIEAHEVVRLEYKKSPPISIYHRNYRLLPFFIAVFSLILVLGARLARRTTAP